jgi:hypothetical protein
MRPFLRANSPSIFFGLAFLAALVGQAIVGMSPTTTSR